MRFAYCALRAVLEERHQCTMRVLCHLAPRSALINIQRPDHIIQLIDIPSAVVSVDGHCDEYAEIRRVRAQVIGIVVRDF